VVEYIRRVAGTAHDQARGPLAILGGTSRTRVWYARGVGEVLVKDETSLDVAIPGRAERGTLSATVQSALQSATPEPAGLAP
jgi:hypothetical protein